MQPAEPLDHSDAQHTSSDPSGDAEAATGALERLRRFGGNGFAREMSAIFAEQAPEQLAAARAAAARDDREAVAHAAHGLRGSCAQLGAVHAARLCKALETQAPSGDLPAIMALLAGLEHATASHLEWLGRELDESNLERGQ
ncbi:MAG: Hpt domain-containing protein [Gemmatimonadota bacterium]